MTASPGNGSPRLELVLRDLERACRSLASSLELEGLELQASYDPATRCVLLRATAPDSQQLRGRDLEREIFQDFPFHLNLAPGPEDRLRLELVLQGEAGPVRQVVMESAFGLLPDTGGTEQAEWEAFTAQLVYTVDGETRTLEPPDLFLDSP